MSGVTILHTANAGFIAEAGGVRIAVDAFHRGLKPEGFPGVTEELWAELRELPAPDIVFFTHCHPDHFSWELAERARKTWPSAVFFLPERRLERQILLAGPEMTADWNGVSLRFLRLTHENEAYHDVPQYGLFLTWEGKTLFTAGDGEITDPALPGAIQPLGVDVAVLNFPWLCLRGGRKVLQEVLRPGHLLIHHFPAAEADALGYREAAARAGERYFPDADVRLLTEPLQREKIV